MIYAAGVGGSFVSAPPGDIPISIAEVARVWGNTLEEIDDCGERPTIMIPMPLR